MQSLNPSEHLHPFASPPPNAAAPLHPSLPRPSSQVRTLQVSNYSLSLHLQKATSTNVLGGSRNPDVF